MHIQVITAAPKKEEAEKIAKKLVEKRLAACVQIIAPVASIYRWEEEIVTGEEWLCLIKTSRKLFDRVERTILEIHPYEVPEILAMPVVAGNSKYLDWLDSVTINSMEPDDANAGEGGVRR